jgi:RNA polymerase sigma-70 factor (ECF subfamily)
MGMAEAEDADLVRRIAAGGAREEEAELCRRFAPRARLYGLRHLRCEQRALDLAQSVLLATLVAVREGRVEDPDRIDRFVLGVCRNFARKLRAADARAEPVDPAEIDVGAAMPKLETVDTRALADCLARLGQRAFTIVMLSFQAGAPAAEIATKLSTTATNVRVMRHRAIGLLRRCLDGQEEVAS